MNKRSAIYFCIILLLLVIFPSSVMAWARHDQMTAEAVKDMGWLDRFDGVAVTEYAYEDQTINQGVVRYYNKNPVELGPTDFYYHYLYEPVLFFKGEDMGSTMDAKQILVDFCDEPDWEMDKDLKLSWMQAFHGESQGYRHMYYPAGTFHIPLAFFPQGKTPERAVHFYSMAKNAFENGDTYWGFRFLARALHYVQDMSQPYHTRQLYWRFFSFKSPYDGTVQIIKNYHFAYESYQANLFRLEQQGAMPERLVDAVRGAAPIEMKGPEMLVKQIAYKSFWKSAKTMKESIGFLGKQYLDTDEVQMSEEEFFMLTEKTGSAAEAFHDDLEQRTALSGIATKSFLEFARKDLKLDEYQV